MTSRILKGGTETVKSVLLGYGTICVDGIPIAHSTTRHMQKAHAEYYAWKYNLEGYTDAMNGFIKTEKFCWQKYWPSKQ